MFTTALLALLLAGCGVSERPAATEGTPPPATAPAADPPTPTMEPSPLPPTAAPAASPTAPPTPRPTDAAVEPTLGASPDGLPVAVPWVRIENTVYAQGSGGQTLDLTFGGRFFPPVTAAVAADGSRIAFSDGAGSPRRLVVAQVGDGDIRLLPEQGAGEATEGTFSPEGRSIAYTLLDGDTWQLRVADLAGGERVIAEGLTRARSPSDLPLVQLPFAWTGAGLLVQRVLWATDAPAQGVALLDPLDGAVRAELPTEHLGVSASPDGARVALVTGIAPIADTPRQGVTVVELATGARRELIAEQDQMVRAVRWSPDGQALLVSAAERWDSPVTTVRALRADGSNEQVVEFGVRGFWLDVRDIAWADAQTPLVLVVNLQERRVELHALPLTSFDATGLRPLGEFPQPDDMRETVAILYVP